MRRLFVGGLEYWSLASIGDGMINASLVKLIDDGSYGYILEVEDYDCLDTNLVSRLELCTIAPCDESYEVVIDDITSISPFAVVNKTDLPYEVKGVVIATVLLGNKGLRREMAAEKLQGFIGTASCHGAVMEAVCKTADLSDNIRRDLFDSFLHRMNGRGAEKSPYASCVAAYIMKEEGLYESGVQFDITLPNDMESQTPAIMFAKELVELSGYGYGLKKQKGTDATDAILGCVKKSHLYKDGNKVYFRFDAASILSIFSELEEYFEPVHIFSDNAEDIGGPEACYKAFASGCDMSHVIAVLAGCVFSSVPVNKLEKIREAALSVDDVKSMLPFINKKNRASLWLCFYAVEGTGSDDLMQEYKDFLLNRCDIEGIEVITELTCKGIISCDELMNFVADNGSAVPQVAADILKFYVNRDNLSNIATEEDVDRFRWELKRIRKLFLAANNVSVEIDDKVIQYLVRCLKAVVKGIEETFGVEFRASFGELVLRSIDIFDNKLRKYVENLRADSANYVETHPLLAELLGELEGVIVAPGWWTRFTGMVLRDIDGGSLKKVEDILRHMKDNPHLIYEGRVRDGGPKLMKVLGKAVKPGININKTKWSTLYNKSRSKKILSLKFKVEDSSFTKLGMSVWTSSWTSCMNVLDGLKRDTVPGVLLNPECVVFYTTTGTVVERGSSEHDDMFSRAMLRVIYKKGSEEPIGVLIDTVYTSVEDTKDVMIATLKKKLDAMGIDLYVPADYGVGERVYTHCYSQKDIGWRDPLDVIPFQDTLGHNVEEISGNKVRAFGFVKKI